MINEDEIRISLQSFIQILLSKQWSKPQIAKAIGVTPYQVYLYGNGTTKSPKAKICMNIYKQVNIDGKKVLLNLYSNYKDLEQHYKVETNDSTM